MMINSLPRANIVNKKVLLRVDFNVAMKGGKPLEKFKIESAFPTIQYLLKKHCQVIIISHLGRPDGKMAAALTLKPFARILKQQFVGKKIAFVPDKMSGRLVKKVWNMKDDIVLLENLRFDKREEKNGADFARTLSNLADIYVNEAFAVSHRKSASVAAITKYLPSFAGLNFIKEVAYLTQALVPPRPAIALIGGIKTETKIPVIKNIIGKYDKILLGGVVAATFLCAKGYELGNSLYDKEQLSLAETLLKSPKIILPKDVVVSCRNKVRLVKISNNKVLCLENEQICDIGPETIKYYSQLIRKAAGIVWNGPMGRLEEEKFKHGSIALARIIAARSSGKAVGIAGGGETVAAIEKSGMLRYYDFISTGGGAMLEFLSGKKLPGVEALCC